MVLQIKKIWFSEGKIFAEFRDGRAVGVPIAWYPNLSKGSSAQLNDYEIWGDAQYIHWPALDEDISAEGLLALSQNGMSQSTFN